MLGVVAAVAVVERFASAQAGAEEDAEAERIDAEVAGFRDGLLRGDEREAREAIVTAVQPFMCVRGNLARDPAVQR